MKSVRLGDEAEAELAAAGDWYEAQRPGLKAELLLEIRHVLERISLFPASGVATRVRGRVAVRRALVQRFPFAIVYVDDEETAVVIAIAHTSRKPKYWSKRLEKRR